ncbi:hypothetical protein QA612_06260 [Evansella sp. AB-P1]|uniref:hypothetical protein n=1 Tax=Evansella sp. AB-P1 TaxID=3037653 RepID=UPI0024201BBD|nr:hypothetical protein [Evansella sp. AB-P1]MDG5787090.1 hypothetical protein [Evansella sp. AB-P1]
MRFKFVFIIAFLFLLLTACNSTEAEDPDYSGEITGFHGRGVFVEIETGSNLRLSFTDEITLQDEDENELTIDDLEVGDQIIAWRFGNTGTAVNRMIVTKN